MNAETLGAIAWSALPQLSFGTTKVVVAKPLVGGL
jgi:hypothetical protein